MVVHLLDTLTHFLSSAIAFIGKPRQHPTSTVNNMDLWLRVKMSPGTFAKNSKMASILGLQIISDRRDDKTSLLVLFRQLEISLIHS